MYERHPLGDPIRNHIGQLRYSFIILLYSILFPSVAHIEEDSEIHSPKGETL